MKMKEKYERTCTPAHSSFYPIVVMYVGRRLCLLKSWFPNESERMQAYLKRSLSRRRCGLVLKTEMQGVISRYIT